MLTMLSEKFSRPYFEISSNYFSQKIGFDIPSKLETVCVKCQNLCTGKNVKISNLSSAEFVWRVIKVNTDLSLQLKSGLRGYPIRKAVFQDIQ